MGIYKTIKSATGIRLQIIGVLVTIAISKIEGINEFLVTHHLIQDGGKNVMLGAPHWAWAIIFFLGYFLIWFLAYAHKLRTQIEESRIEISKLRRKGVSIRNDGCNVERVAFKDSSECNAWKKQARDWQVEVYDAIKKISMADAEWFNCLDILPKHPRCTYSPFDEDHAKVIREHDFLVCRLGEMIRDLWGRA